MYHTRGCIDGYITMSSVIAGSCCKLTVGEVTKTKNCFRPLTQNFTCFNTFKVVVGRKKQVEFPTFAWKWETCHEEWESRDRPRILFLVFRYISNVLLRWFRFHISASGVRSFVVALLKMVAATFAYVHIVLASVPSRLYLVTSFSQLTFKPKTSSYFCLVSGEGQIHFRWFYICAEDFGPQGFYKNV